MQVELHVKDEKVQWFPFNQQLEQQLFTYYEWIHSKGENKKRNEIRGLLKAYSWCSRR